MGGQDGHECLHVQTRRCFVGPTINTCSLLFCSPLSLNFLTSYRIYRPEKPVGERFRLTGAKTPIARMYHATSILTAKGDILVVSFVRDWERTLLCSL